jgi:hypothetical protein
VLLIGTTQYCDGDNGARATGTQIGNDTWWTGRNSDGSTAALLFHRRNPLLQLIAWGLRPGPSPGQDQGAAAGETRRPRHRPEIISTQCLSTSFVVGRGLWVVRYCDKSSKPMKLPKARTYALEMVKGIRPGKVIADPIGRLHRLHLDAHEPMPEMAQVWATETADYPPLYSRPSRLSESPKGGNYPLEFYPDG